MEGGGYLASATGLMHGANSVNAWSAQIDMRHRSPRTGLVCTAVRLHDGNATCELDEFSSGNEYCKNNTSTRWIVARGNGGLDCGYRVVSGQYIYSNQ